MDNYVYIIAGLPELTLTFENIHFVYDSVKQYFYTSLSDKDKKYVDLLEAGFNDETINSDLYLQTLHAHNRFIREYFLFDLFVNNMKVHYLAKRLNQNPEKYLITAPDVPFEEEKVVQNILNNPDFVLREQQMDLLKWNKATEITRMDFFNLNVILAFLVKAHLVQRWAEMDEKRGSEMFETLLKEVRGTFQNIDYHKIN